MCLMCFEAAFTSLNNRILTSKLCGHKICNSCLQTRGKSTDPSSNVSGNDSNTKNLCNIYTCPLCGEVSSLTEWVEREGDETFFEQEALISQRVASVYNLTRNHFDNTPKYNDYIEMRESIVYDLLYHPSEKERKRIQEELEIYEAEHQKQIVECQQLAKRLEREWIRDIVSKEGTFYERVQSDILFSSNKTKLVHPLQRRYMDLFVEDESKLETSPKTQSRSTQDTALTGLTLGTTGLPKPLDSNLNYLKLTRKPYTDKAAMLRACGMSKKTIGNRVLQEVWGGLCCR